MKKYISIPVLAGLALMMVVLSNCKKADLHETTTNDPNILEYLQKDSLQRFTKLIAVIEKAGYSTALNTYGTYTFFAPTDAAIDDFLKKNNIASIDAMKPTDLQDLVKFHLLEEAVRTSSFNDGKLPSITDYGQFLVTSVVNKDGASSFLINRQGLVLQPNIALGNGIIHVVDHVLTPSLLSVAKLIEKNPDYSIFTQALKETGYYDTLNLQKDSKGAPVWLTVVAQTNQSYKDSGILDYNALKAKYSKNGNPKLANDSLHLYIAYHILPGIKYLADIVTVNSHETLAPLEVVTNKYINNRVLVNDDSYSTINGTVYEKGIELEIANSDMSATNGVVHKAIGALAIKVRNPFPVYWDLCATQPELTRLTSIYRKANYLFDFGDSTKPTFKDIKWEKSCLKYRYSGNGVGGDYWQVGMGTSSSNTNNLGTCASNTWIQFTTPLLVKGKYKVWFCYYTQNSTVSAVQGSFDSVPLTSALIQFHTKLSSVAAADEASLAAVGWKWWSNAPSGSTAARMLGIVDVKATGRHKIRFDLLSGTNADCNFDMVQFIPVDWPSQTSPHFSKDGTAVYP